MSESAAKPLTRDLAPFGLRMQSDLKARIQAAAEANNRSMNAEIVVVLEREYPAPFPGDEEILIAAAATKVFDPTRSNGEFGATYRHVLKYMRDVLHVADPERLIEGMSDDPRLYELSLKRVSEWMDRNYRPWLNRLE